MLMLFSTLRKTVLLIIFCITSVIFCKHVYASPPPWIGNPDCIVGGIVKNIEVKFEKGNRGPQYQECLSPKHTITDCEWIIPAGEDKNYVLATIQVSGSKNDQSPKDSSMCTNLYPENKEYTFSLSPNLSQMYQLKIGDTVSGKVIAGGSFSAIQKEGYKIPLFSKSIYFIQEFVSSRIPNMLNIIHQIRASVGL
jgi:hypothetical protein